MTETLIEVRELAKTYYTEAGEIPVLHGINMDIQQGEFVAIMGASGSGKSTFMNILGCLDKASSGEYRLAGQVVANLDKDALAKLRNRVIGFVFQGFNLLSRTTLADNVALPLVYAQVGRAERQQRAEKMLEKVGLARFFHHRPNQISGGQQQRVAIARALVNNPTLILADEPTGNLDTQTAEDIEQLLFQLNRELGTTLVLVTHDPKLAEQCQRHFELLDGHIIEHRNGED